MSERPYKPIKQFELPVVSARVTGGENIGYVRDQIIAAGAADVENRIFNSDRREAQRRAEQDADYEYPEWGKEEKDREMRKAGSDFIAEAIVAKAAASAIPRILLDGDLAPYEQLPAEATSDQVRTVQKGSVIAEEIQNAAIAARESNRELDVLAPTVMKLERDNISLQNEADLAATALIKANKRVAAMKRKKTT